MKHTANSKSSWRPQSGAEAEGRGETPVSRLPGDITRTSGADGRFCRLCGAEIQGRRRNGFCSDRCRLRFRRRDEKKRLEKLFENVDGALTRGTSVPGARR